MNHRCWKLSARDLTSLWEECPRCLYMKHVRMKHVRGISRPPRLVPAALRDLDTPMKPRSWHSHSAETAAAPALSAAWRGVIAFEERWVQSDPLILPGRESTVVLYGQFDTAVRFDDDTFGLLAFTTHAAGTEAAIRRHSRHLHACALAAEYPAPRALALGKVRKLGLLVVQPDRLIQQSSPTGGTSGSIGETMRWVDFPRDDRAFLQFLDQVVGLLEQPEPPAPSHTCTFCAVAATRRPVGVSTLDYLPSPDYASVAPPGTE